MGRKKPPDKLSEDEIPPSTDPRWGRWADKLAVLLLEPKTARELREALPELSFAVVVNTLSWMDLQGSVRRITDPPPTRWTLTTPPPPPPPRPRRCLRCGGPWTHSETGVICLFCGRSPSTNKP